MLLTMIFVVMAGSSHMAFGQQDHDFYKKRAYEYLSEGNCEKAQELYTIWNKLTGTRELDIEARIETCKKGKQDSALYKQKLEGCLSRNDYDGAQRIYDSWRNATGTRDLDAETRIANSRKEGHTIYKQKANEYLSKGDCTSAQKAYNVWEELTGTRDPDFEARIDACKKGGVLINGIVWATRNVASPGNFTTRPEDTGWFYQWNRKKGWLATGDVTGWNSSPASGDVWSSANDPCPEGWRLPTKDELNKLIYSDSKWTTLNGRGGRWFGSGNYTVFLPAAGYRGYSGALNQGLSMEINGASINTGSGGYYWSSSSQSLDNGWLLNFFDSTATENTLLRVYGHTVRCVGK